MSPKGSGWTRVTSPRRASSSAAISVIASSRGSKPSTRASKLTERARARACCSRTSASGTLTRRLVRWASDGAGGATSRAPIASARRAGGSTGTGGGGGALERDPPVARPGGGRAAALGQPGRRALEGRVGHQAGGQALARLERVGVGLLVGRPRPAAGAPSARPWPPGARSARPPCRCPTARARRSPSAAVTTSSSGSSSSSTSSRSTSVSRRSNGPSKRSSSIGCWRASGVGIRWAEHSRARPPSPGGATRRVRARVAGTGRPPYASAQGRGMPTASRTISQRIADAAGRDFVGRRQELELLRAAADAGDAPVLVAFVHGPGGIGKSRLLRGGARRRRRRSARRSLRLDCREIEPTPAGFARARWPRRWARRERAPDLGRVAAARARRAGRARCSRSTPTSASASSTPGCARRFLPALPDSRR